MAKRIGLQQLAQKKYDLIEDLPPEIIEALGILETAFDALIHGDSNNGKSSFVAILLDALIECLKCKCEYVAFEEAHGRTIQQTMIDRYDMFNKHGNAMQIVDHYTYQELDERMGRRQSAKIFVIDSIQASKFTYEQIAELKRKYVTSKRKKILLIISWSEGGKPQGAAAKAVEYMANLKLFVSKLVVFPKSRYGGGKPYVIHRETAIRRCGGEREFYKFIGEKMPKATKPKKEKTPSKTEPSVTSTTVQVLPPETDQEKEQAMLDGLKQDM